MYEFINNVSMILLSAMLLFTLLFGLVYFLGLGWNVFRAIRDPERGFSYYFSKEGPEN